MKRDLSALFILLLSTITCTSVWAQATAQISGTVRDQSGAVLPGVEVIATQTDTGIRRSTVTNETGSYVLPNLAVGPYRLEAGLPGFRTFVQTGIVLQVNSSAVINPQLAVGQVTEAVEVQANVTQVETRNTAVGSVIENERILELPLNARQVTDLITLSGGAVQTGKADNKSMQGGVNISVAGGQDFGVSYSLDGATHNNPYDGAQLPFPFPDALQEFKVELSGTSAGAWVKSGGSVNAVTKAGTNEFHGNLFEFVRNYKFNARSFFAPARDTLKRNQFGGTLGGPLMQNKLFFFGGYQGTMTRTDPTDAIAYVPTAAMLAGDFTAIASPACNAGRQITLRAPFANNRINPALFSKAAMNIAVKLPKALDDCGKVNYGLVQKVNEHQAVGRVDYQWGDKHTIFGRYIATAYSKPTPYSLSGGNLLTTASEDRNLGVGLDNLGQSYALGSTYLIGPKTVNAYRLTVNRTAIHRLGASFFSAPSVGVKAYSYIDNSLRMDDITGGFNLGRDADATFRTTTYQTSNDVNLIRGNHQVTVGTNLAHWRVNQRGVNQGVGLYTFTGTATGLGLSDFLTGSLTTQAQGSPTDWSITQTYIGVYAADSWKAIPGLTFDYGVRWEPWIPINLTMGSIYAFDDNRFRQGIRSTVYKNGPAGLYFPGDPGFPKRSYLNKKLLLFSPRAGLAWDVHGDGRMSVRISYGLSYDLAYGQILSSSSGAPPQALRTTIQSPAGGFEDPWRDYPGGNPYPYYVTSPETLRFPLRSGYIPLSLYDMATPSTQSWNVTIQRQAADFLISASYLGSQTAHLWQQKAYNRAVYIPGGPCTINGVVYSTCSTTGNTDQRRRLSLENAREGEYYGQMGLEEDGGTSNYNGLLLSVRRQATRGLNIGGNYTWSHCIGDDYASGGAYGGGYLDPTNRRFDTSNCTSDRRQVFNLTAVAETPQFAGRTLRRIASGWRLSGIYRRSTGEWLTILSGLDRALNGDRNTQRPNQILPKVYGDRDSYTRFLNPGAFEQPALGTLGNMEPNNVEGPGTWQLDMALSRTLQFRETQRLEFRAEAFNVLNSFIRGNPSTNLNANTFGQINTSSDARIMQFALKFNF